MEKLNLITEKIDNIVWSVPLIILILGCGIFLSIKTNFIQVKRLGKALKLMFSKDKDGHGEVSSFAALCTALSATIGTGNIVGVATALATGGPGALFWLEIAAFFGMATKYAEGLLAIKYRITDKNGNILGGPFYYIENGLGEKWKWLGKIFAFFGMTAGIMGIGTITQINSITSAANSFFDPDKSSAITLFNMEYTYTTIITGIIITICIALIIIGGIKRIASVSEVVVPIMVVLYVLSCLIILITHITEIPNAIVTIIKSACGLKQVAGGTAGAAIILAMRSGIARGIFSNEAGLGSAPIAAAAAQTKEPVEQGLVTMTGTFIDTIVVCSMTGLAIVISGEYENPALQGFEITNAAFRSGLPFPSQISSFLLMLCIVFFAFTTILGWNYYSERCLSYLTGSHKKATIIFRWLYVLAVFIGPYLTIEAVWNLADICNGLMALPNIVALLMLSGVIASETKDYLKREKNKSI